MFTELCRNSADWKLFRAVDDNGKMFYAVVYHYDETDGSFPHWRTFLTYDAANHFFNEVSYANQEVT